MSSIPQFYSEYCTFPSHLSEFSTPTSTSVPGVGAHPMWSTSHQESLVPPLFDNALLDHVVSPQSQITSSVRMSSYPGGKLGTLDFAAVSDYYKVDLSAAMPAGAGLDNFGAAFQPNMCQFREDYCCGFLDDFKPLFPAAGENWVRTYVSLINYVLPSLLFIYLFKKKLTACV
jgi:hypothetical protein